MGLSNIDMNSKTRDTSDILNPVSPKQLPNYDFTQSSPGLKNFRSLILKIMFDEKIEIEDLEFLDDDKINHLQRILFLKFPKLIRTS